MTAHEIVQTTALRPGDTLQWCAMHRKYVAQENYEALRDLRARIEKLAMEWEAVGGERYLSAAQRVRELLEPIQEVPA